MLSLQLCSFSTPPASAHRRAYYGLPRVISLFFLLDLRQSSKPIVVKFGTMRGLVSKETTQRFVVVALQFFLN